MENKKVNEKKLLELFDQFDTTSCPIITESFLRSMNNNQNWEKEATRKIKALKGFVDMIQTSVNNKYMREMNTKFSISRNLFFYADANMPQVLTKLRITQLGKSDVVPLSLNIPLDRLVKMPALEVYSLLSAATHNAIKCASKNLNNEFDRINIDKVENTKVDNLQEAIEDKTEKIEQSDDRVNAKNILKTYLREFIPEIAGGEFDDFDAIAELVASEIVDELDEEGLKRVVGWFFSPEEYNEMAESKVAQFLGKDVASLKGRTGRLYNKAQELWLDPSKEPEALSVTQQYQALMSTRLKSQFAEIVKGQTSGGLQNTLDLKAFCQNYVDTLMRASNVKPVSVEFERKEKGTSNNNDFGTFIDEGDNGAYIYVNLNKISSVSELVATLSHETAHAIESSISKIKGKTTKEGFGLTENISNDISNTGLKKGTEAYEVLRELNKYCYRVNPHERNARYAETVGLKFLAEGCNIQDPQELAQLETMAQTMANYQSETLEILKLMANETAFAELSARVAKILSMSDISEYDRQLIDERIKYLERIRKTLPKSPEKIEKESMESESLKSIRRFIEKQEQKKQITEMADMNILDGPSM